MSNKDKIYSEPQKNIGDFIFDNKVASVFEDMIHRSVPGYQAIVNMVGMVAEEYVQENTKCFDLGCSVGACSASMGQRINKSDVRIIAVDNSDAMIEQCKANLKKFDFKSYVDVVCQDIRDTEINNASMVVLNFTLQFFDPGKRNNLLQKIFDGMNSRGVLVVSEKVKFKDQSEEDFQIKMHHAFKRLQGYSDLEISQKRSALEHVLIPDTIEQHKKRLRDVGFENIYIWFQSFNFVSLVAHKC